jgi:hypothetical protein
LKKNFQVKSSYRISQANVFSKFDTKSGFWQIQIHEEDKYKIAFVTPFGHYEWNIMPFRLKNALSEFQNIMNKIFDPIAHFSIVYIDDVLIFSKSIDEHWKYLICFLIDWTFLILIRFTNKNYHLTILKDG